LRRRSGKSEEIDRLVDHPVVLKLTRVGSRSFYIPRDKEEPPLELVKLIWPELDAFIRVRDAEQLDPAKPIGEHRLCLAGAGFVNLLQQFRRYLLQDAAILQPMFPAHPIWAHDVFRHPLYAPFAERVRFQHFNSPESTREQQLAAAVPAVAAQLQTLRQEHSHQLATLGSQLASVQRALDRTQQQNQQTQQQNQQILDQLRGHRLVPLPGRGSDGSSWADLAIAGGGGPAAAAATPAPHPTTADNSGPLPLASSGELDPIPDRGAYPQSGR
jgi:Centromere DNA-binding protein complex CBF3 subunit, domain 2